VALAFVIGLFDQYLFAKTSFIPTKDNIFLIEDPAIIHVHCDAGCNITLEALNLTSIL
jgi:hypothetical protein